MANENQFNGKAQFYNSRPTYPKECISYLVNKFSLSVDSTVADIGAGTGILTQPFLNVGCNVYAVEPNEDMFLELNKNLSHFSNIKLLNTSAEKTGILPCCCDAVLVGTAFHWFDKEKFRTECKRILKNDKNVAILRISNNSNADKEIDKIKHYSEEDLNEAKSFFGNGFVEHISFEYTQIFDEDRYVENLLSSATAPLPTDTIFEDYVNKCKIAYKKHFGNEVAKLPFVVNCYIGKLID